MQNQHLHFTYARTGPCRHTYLKIFNPKNFWHVAAVPTTDNKYLHAPGMRGLDCEQYGR